MSLPTRFAALITVATLGASLLACGGRTPIGVAGTGTGPQGGDGTDGPGGNDADAAVGPGPAAGESARVVEVDGGLLLADGALVKEEALFSPGVGSVELAPALGDRLAGHWVQIMMTDCEYSEEWFSFAPPSTFARTLMALSCQAPAQPGEVYSGTYEELPGRQLRLAYQNELGRSFDRELTATVVHLERAKLGVIPAFSAASYVQDPSSASYVRRQKLTERGPDGREVSSRTSETQLTFEAPLPGRRERRSCLVKVDLDVTATTAGGGQESASESYIFDCTISPSGETGWNEISLDLFRSGDPRYGPLRFVATTGIEHRYSEPLVKAFSEAFFPVLFFERELTTVLFENTFTSFYDRSAEGPDTQP